MSNPSNITAELSTGPITGSKKIYVPHDNGNFSVGMREISLEGGSSSLTVYYTSGPYTQENYKPNLEQGIEPIRDAFINNRSDHEVVDGLMAAKVSGSAPRKVKQAKQGTNLTQLHYARKGIITPEMDEIANSSGANGDVLLDPTEVCALQQQLQRTVQVQAKVMWWSHRRFTYKKNHKR